MSEATCVVLLNLKLGDGDKTADISVWVIVTSVKSFIATLASTVSWRVLANIIKFGLLQNPKQPRV